MASCTSNDRGRESGRRAGLEPDLEGSSCRADEPMPEVFKETPWAHPSRNANESEQESVPHNLSARAKGKLKEDKETPMGRGNCFRPSNHISFCSSTRWGIMEVLPIAHLSPTWRSDTTGIMMAPTCGNGLDTPCPEPCG